MRPRSRPQNAMSRRIRRCAAHYRLGRRGGVSAAGRLTPASVCDSGSAGPSVATVARRPLRASEQPDRDDRLSGQRGTALARGWMQEAPSSALVVGLWGLPCSPGGSGRAATELRHGLFFGCGVCRQSCRRAIRVCVVPATGAWWATDGDRLRTGNRWEAGDRTRRRRAPRAR